MATMHTEERIGEAWRQHRMGNNDAAIDTFREVLTKHPGHLDALYGIGLALRANGKDDDARESFNKALELAKEALSAVNKTSAIEGHSGNNDLDTYEDDRYLMLQFMISQRLEELDTHLD